MVVALAVLGSASPALAVKVGESLYVKARNTQLKESAEPTAGTLATLQPGRAVTYRGRQAGTPWCLVSVALEKKGEVQGVIFQSSLAVSPPSPEVSRKNPSKPLSPEAFASSGAAIKAVGPGTLEYGQTLPKADSAKQLKELVGRTNRITEAQVAAYLRARDLPDTGVRPVKASGSGKSGRQATPAKGTK